MFGKKSISKDSREFVAVYFVSKQVNPNKENGQFANSTQLQLFTKNQQQTALNLIDIADEPNFIQCLLY